MYNQYIYIYTHISIYNQYIHICIYILSVYIYNQYTLLHTYVHTFTTYAYKIHHTCLCIPFLPTKQDDHPNEDRLRFPARTHASAARTLPSIWTKWQEFHQQAWKETWLSWKYDGKWLVFLKLWTPSYSNMVPFHRETIGLGGYPGLKNPRSAKSSASFRANLVNSRTSFLGREEALLRWGTLE